MFDRVRYEPRRLIIGGAMLAGLIVIAVVAAIVIHFTGSTPSTDGNSPAAADHPTGYPTTQQSSHRPTATAPVATPATDVARWNARPPVTPRLSDAFPAIPTNSGTDPSSYALAFATELFSRDYSRASRTQLLAWAQYEDSPLRSPEYPKADWTKVLVDSLTDLTWDGADDTPVPADGPWLVLRSQSAKDTVSGVKVSLDPQWEQRIHDGYQPPDPMATARDVTLTVTRHVTAAGRTTTTTYSVALALQLGTSIRGHGYGVAATNNYVIKKVG